MRCVIIPCCNEGAHMESIISEAEKSSADRVLIVENGSEDESFDVIKKNLTAKTNILYVNMPLGHDIPKAAGLYFSILDEGEHFVFYDGDMIGVTKDDIDVMFKALEAGTDLILTDCYYDGDLPSGLAAYVLAFRRMLNKELNIFGSIKYASPSHGPMGLSKKLALSVPIEYMGIPPLVLVYAVKNNFKVDIGLKKLHADLGSKEREEKQRLKMAETLVGDCIYAMKTSKDYIPNRKYDGIEYTGFHEDRRFDILELITLNAGLKT